MAVPPAGTLPPSNAPPPVNHHQHHCPRPPPAQRPPSEEQQARTAESSAILAGAQLKQQEQKDLVKAMNQMVLYSKCMAIRDAQVLEKKNILSEEEERARRWG